MTPEHWMGEPEIVWERRREQLERRFQEWEDDQYRFEQERAYQGSGDDTAGVG